MKDVTTLVNEDKLFSVIGKFFTDGKNLLLELIQNAQRANAKNVNIQAPYKGEVGMLENPLPQNLLSIEDDGTGIKDVIALLGIAISAWGKDIDAQDPAGMGFMQLLALSQQVYVQSGFGSVRIDSPRFLNSRAYRQEVLESINTEDAISYGTKIVAEMKSYWSFYVNSNMECYQGYDQLRTVINGEAIVPIKIDNLVASATKKNNLTMLTQYMGNDLFIEIGASPEKICNHKSIVNWYGQLLPMYMTYGLASNYNVRFYYAVRKNTPLTPRFPDRTSINNDEKLNAFVAYLNQCLEVMLSAHFRNYGVESKFTPSINANLLEDYYRYGKPTELEQLDYVPVVDNPFYGNGEMYSRISTKSYMRQEGIMFCVNELKVDDIYSMGADFESFRCYLVGEHLEPYLTKAGLEEVAGVTSMNIGSKMINMEPLRLYIEYQNGNRRAHDIKQALLMDYCNDVIIFADKEEAILDIFDQYFEETYQSSEANPEDIADSIREQIDLKLAEQFSVLKASMFDFLPQHHNIAKINFQTGNLAVSYRDGNRKIYRLTN